MRKKSYEENSFAKNTYKEHSCAKENLQKDAWCTCVTMVTRLYFAGNILGDWDRPMSLWCVTYQFTTRRERIANTVWFKFCVGNFFWFALSFFFFKKISVRAIIRLYSWVRKGVKNNVIKHISHVKYMPEEWTHCHECLRVWVRELR